jgi:hypothetical protein
MRNFTIYRTAIGQDISPIKSRMAMGAENIRLVKHKKKSQKIFAHKFVVRGGADKSLAPPGRGKKATATKHRIYSTYSPRSSIKFLSRCSNVCKPLKKRVVIPARFPQSPRQ